MSKKITLVLSDNVFQALNKKVKTGQILTPQEFIRSAVVEKLQGPGKNE